MLMQEKKKHVRARIAGNGLMAPLIIGAARTGQLPETEVQEA